MKRSVFILSMAILTACGAANTADDKSTQLQPEAETITQNSPQTPAQAPVEVAQTSQVPEDQPATSISIANPNGITELKWEDLMPIGEDEVLAQLYETYYQDLRQDLVSQSQRLQDVNSEAGGDVSALIGEGAANDTMDQIGTFNVVEELDGLDVRIPGYVVPLDFNSEGVYSEFLLVPYFGACLHTPPPPPNQIVYVKASPATKIASIYEPVWIEGIMKTGKFESETGDSAYELSLSNIEAYDY